FNTLQPPPSKSKLVNARGGDSKDQDSAVEEYSDYEQNDGPCERVPPKMDLLPTTRSKPKCKKGREAVKDVKPPTLVEMKELRDTQNLFHSNLFKLQVKEMLEELQLKAKYSEFTERWIETFSTFTRQMKDGLLEHSKLEVPLRLSQKASGFIFSRPTREPYLIGAASTGTLLGPKIVVDVALEMPKECFHKEDFLNLRYDQKRALYLTYVVERMRESPEYSQDHFAFNYFGNNPLKPVLELTPAAKHVAKRLQVRLFITAPLSSFKAGRFVPWNNNIRPSYFSDDWDDGQPLPSTQHYNSSVLFDLTLSENQAHLEKFFKGKRNFQDGLLLLKVWLRQRELDVGFSGVSAYILASFIVYLNQNRILHQSSSSYQVARTVWNQMANTDWTTGISLATGSAQTEEVAKYFDVCFLDVTGQYNLAANVSRSLYKRVQAEAKLAVELLNDMKTNQFPHIFMQKSPLYSRVDNILKITNGSSINQMLMLHSEARFKYDYVNFGYPQLLRLLTNLLQKGLGDRVNDILPLETATAAWPVETRPPDIGKHIILGLILDPDHAYNVLNKGPAPNEDPEGAAEFRRFWGEKSNLRRFQDGSITEAVVWGALKDPPYKKRVIVRQIVLHLLDHHFQLDSEDVQYIAAELEQVYRLTPCFKIARLKTKPQLDQETDAEAASPHVIRCYDELARQLHGLDDLPLEIVSISGTSPVFRYCEPEPVLPQARLIANRMHTTHVQQVVIQLGQSGKWPNELGALRALKTAFLIEIGEKLEAQYRIQWKITTEGLMVLKQGFCFMIQLAHSKELALVKQSVTERGTTIYVDNPTSRALERQHYILPKVSGALHSLHQTHPAFGPTVLLAKRWLATQLIDDGLWPNIATELLVAFLFQQRHTPQPIAAPQTGFFRFLQLLSHSDWKSELMILNFNNNCPEHELSDLEHSFRSERHSFPPVVVTTSYDQQHAGRLWTSDQAPSSLVLGHVTRLSREALGMIESSLMSKVLRFVRPAQLFRASNEGYDLVIQIRPDVLPNTLCHDHGSPFVPFGQPNFQMGRAGVNCLAKIVNQLRSAYSDFAAFFYNPHGGKEVAIMWRPSSEFAPKPFKVNEVQSCTPCDNEKVQVLKETLVEDFKLLLKDFYLRIVTPEELIRQQKEHLAPKRNLNSNKKAEKTSPKLKRKK
ncbi:hypothetical protein KR018_007548, partial [Drosophila ironensis]